MDNPQLSPAVARIMHDAAHQILDSVLKDDALLHALYACRGSERQAWVQGLPEDSRRFIGIITQDIVARCRDLETRLTHEGTLLAERLADALRTHLQELHYGGFYLDGTDLAHSDRQWRLNQCDVAMRRVFAACPYGTPLEEVIAQLVSVAQREEFRDVFPLALHEHRSYLVRRYNEAWVRQLEAAVVTAAPSAVPRIA